MTRLRRLSNSLPVPNQLACN